jgi:hypothetical protein
VLRDVLAVQIDRTQPARDVATLTRRLMDVLAELKGLPKETSAETPVEEFIRGRNQRMSSTARDALFRR